MSPSRRESDRGWEAAESCPRCARPTRVYYDERDAWAVCMRCRVGRWIATGYDQDPRPDGGPICGRFASGRRPPIGAIYTTARFWTDV